MPFNYRKSKAITFMPITGEKMKIIVTPTAQLITVVQYSEKEQLGNPFYSTHKRMTNDQACKANAHCTSPHSWKIFFKECCTRRKDFNA